LFSETIATFHVDFSIVEACLLKAASFLTDYLNMTMELKKVKDKW
jgi:hypothetical protein